MEPYDVIVCCGGIAGSVAATFAAASALKTLLVEKQKTPRNKACSGIQFTYLERLIGEKIPKNVLCTNNLSKVEMVTPKGNVLRGRLGMLNFWRSTFDSWLNERAVRAGAEFCDQTSLVHFQESREEVEVTLAAGEQVRTVRTRYLVGADGSRSHVRRKLRPSDFGKGTGGDADVLRGG